MGSTNSILLFAHSTKHLVPGKGGVVLRWKYPSMAVWNQPLYFRLRSTFQILLIILDGLVYATLWTSGGDGMCNPCAHESQTPDADPRFTTSRQDPLFYRLSITFCNGLSLCGSQGHSMAATDKVFMAGRFMGWLPKTMRKNELQERKRTFSFSFFFFACKCKPHTKQDEGSPR